MSNIDKLNDHELVDLKNAIERELKRRADGPKVTTYYVVSCITDSQNFTDLDCALRCLKSVTEDLMEWVAE
ncbi:TPA_asm: Eaf protein, partial [Salmonella enterica subsp. enterica serovar Bredeney]|nr:Eaf protein [Salmonella enterica subsp. enterica serovar Bredeney]